MDDRSRNIRVLVIAAVRLYREGLADVLGRVPGVTAVGAEPDAREAATRMREWEPDVVLLDIAVPQSQALARQLAQNAPAIPVVALGVDRSEAEIVACAEAGITGYLTREASLEELVEVVATAARGEVHCSPRLAGALVRRLATLAARNQSTEAPEPLPSLTRREREIVGFLEQDFTNKEIACHLGIEVATVKNHVHNLLEKLSVRRRGEAARLAGRARLEIESPKVHAQRPLAGNKAWTSL